MFWVGSGMNQQLISLGISHISHSYDVEKLYYGTLCFLHICDFLLLKYFLSDVLHGEPPRRRANSESLHITNALATRQTAAADNGVFCLALLVKGW